jgi:glutathione peroxidase
MLGPSLGALIPALLTLTMGFNAPGEDPSVGQYSQCKSNPGNIFGFSPSDGYGANHSLGLFKGKVVMIVNVATFWGHTWQYNDFNNLLNTYNNENNSPLVILAFPCNQFLNQEPGKDLTEVKNGIRFVRPGNGYIPHKDIAFFGKLDVNGANSHPLYTFLRGSCSQPVQTFRDKSWLLYDPISQNDVFWNFEKFLIGKNGVPRYRFAPAAWNKGATVQPFLDELINE